MKGIPSAYFRLLWWISQSVNMRERCCAAGKDTDEWKNEKVNTARKTNGTRRRGCGDDVTGIPVMEKSSPLIQTKVFTPQTKGNITGGNKGTVKSFLPVPGE